MAQKERKRRAIVVRHGLRPQLMQAERELSAQLARYGIECVFRAEKDENGCAQEFASREEKLPGVCLVVSLGGDGTLLRAAQYARFYDVPLAGINFGHVGFLTAGEAEDLGAVARKLGLGDYSSHSRMCVRVELRTPDGRVVRDWALNEAAIVSTDHAHPAHVGLGIDGEGITTYGADGLVIATPSGSTAYSFSAGGPVVWPDVEAMVVSPLSAHGLFTRPLVVSPHSRLEVSVLADNFKPMRLWCDGNRSLHVPSGSLITATRDAKGIRLVELGSAPFSSRLVSKFKLPVQGWRGQ